MKKYILLFLVLVARLTSYAQQSDFATLVKQANTYLRIYEHISPHEYETNVNDLHLNKKDLAELKATSSVTNDSIDTYDAQQFMQTKIVASIVSVINQAEFTKQDATTLFKSPLLNVVVSDDKKLYNFALDENQNGTYRGYLSFMYCTEFELPFTVDLELLFDDKSLAPPYTTFSGDGFYAIYKLKGAKEPTYILLNTNKYCMSCYYHGIVMVSLQNNAFETRFSYSVEVRDYDLIITYNPNERSIDVQYQTDDLTPYCTCLQDPEEKWDIEEEEDPFKNPKQCSCTFEYNGQTFVLKK